MVDGSSWKSILGADQHGSTKEVLCLRPWLHDGWPSFRLAIYPFIILIYKPLLAHWASHVHYNLSFLTSCSHFFTGGPLVYACIVWESHESWTYRCMFLSLFFLPSFYCIPSYLIGCVLHLFFFILSTACFASYSLHPERWSSLVHYMENGHIISTVYPTDTNSEILSLRRSSRQREFLRVCLCIIDIIFGAHLFMLRVCAFVYM